MKRLVHVTSSKFKFCSDSSSDDKQGEFTLTMCISVAYASVVDWMTPQDKPLLYKTAESRFTNEAMADEFLRFLEGYIKAEKVKSDAFHGNFLTLHLYFTFLRKTVGKKI